MAKGLRSPTALLFGSWLLVVQVHAAPAVVTAEQWREDLAAFAEQAPKVHKNLFHAMTREQFETAVQHLKERVPTLSRNQIIVELVRIVAQIGDGHSYVSLLEPPISFRRYSIKLYEFPDGVYAVAADPKYKAIVGGRVVQLGNTSFEQAYRAIGEIVPRDNAMQLKWLAPNYATIAEVLDGLGLVKDVENLDLTVIKDGKRVRARLVPGAPRRAHYHGWDTEPGWDEARAPGVAAPLWLQSPTDAYWFKYLREDKLLYVQYNQVQNKADESIDAFFKRVMAFAEANPVERFVLDVRLNGGGNNYLNRPIIHGFIRSDAVNQSGRLFTIIGRQTFSAAMNCVNRMKLNTNTLFVGEPTGSSPNSYGDNAPVVMPNSKLEVRLSTLWWQDMDPRDRRPWQAPDLSAELTFADYKAGRDPAMEAILHYKAEAGIAEQVRAAAEKNDYSGARSAVGDFVRDPLHKYATAEADINRLGYEFIANHQLDQAIFVLKLNVEAFPNSFNTWDSLAEAYMDHGDKELAIQNYTKSLELNPKNLGARDQIAKLRAQ